MTPELTAKFQNGLEILANLSLLNAETHNPCITEQDIVHAMLLLTYTAHNLSQDYQSRLGLSMSQRETLAKEFAKNISQSILLFAGVDVSELGQGEWKETLEGE